MTDEEELHRLWSAGERERLATETIRRYGAEILSLLGALHVDLDEADDVFSDFCERLLRSLERFAYSCSMRTWVYLLARRASQDAKRAAGRRRRRDVSLSEADELGRLVAQVRTRTLTFLRTETKSELAKLRDELSEADRLLLVLRVDRGLAWDEIARVFLDGDDAPPDDVRQGSARLRKRFQLVKERLKSRAQERGLIL